MASPNSSHENIKRTMNVLFLVHVFPALSETFVLNQITGLLERGIGVSIYARWLGDTKKMHQAIERFRLLERSMFAHQERNADQDDLQLSHLQNSYPEIKPYVRAYASKTGKQEYDEGTRRLFYTCVPVLRRDPFDIIHCQFGTLMDEGLLLKRIYGTRSKLVVSFRGYDISSYIQQHGGAISQSLFIEGDAFLPNCEYFRRRLCNIGCDERKITLLRSGIDTRIFPYNPSQLTPTGCVRILTVGRLVEKKGIAYAIQAVARILKKGYSLEYLIAGDGTLRDSLEVLIRDLEIGDHVRLLGAKRQEEIVELLGTTHLFIAPSVTANDGNQEGPVNVLKEAMLTGLPVIGTNHGGIPELIEDGVSGFLVPERNAEAIAAKIEFLLEHPERWEEMGRRGRALIEQQYDADSLNDQLVYLYRTLLDSS